MRTTHLINRRCLVKHLGVSGSSLAASWGSPFQAFAQNPGARTFGIDVSKWGGKIDWHDVVLKLNPRFVFVQAYHMGKDETSSYANPRFANYRRALQRLGLLQGAYLRCHPNANAETLIKRFWTVYTPKIGDILPTLDIEEDYSDCPLWVVDYHSTNEPILPQTWSRFSFWQYTENLHGNGVQGTYDSDYFNGTEADLRAYLL